MSDPLRLVFLGTKDFALPSFRALAATRHKPLALITQPDRPRGRKQQLVPAPLKLEAEALGIPVHQPESINAPDALGLLQALAPDLLVTAAYGQILSDAVLDLPRLGGINLHGSILPKYRGAAPVARAIQRGETETGVTVIRMNTRVDSGGMIAVAPTPIDPNETAGELESRLADLGAPLLADVVERMSAGPVGVLAQDPNLATRAPKLRKEDGRIDWTRSAREVHDLVRAMQPWPTASTSWSEHGGEARPLIVHRTQMVDGSGVPGQVLESGRDRLVVAAGSGAVGLLIVQVPGRKPLPASAFLRGRAIGGAVRFLN